MAKKHWTQLPSNKRKLKNAQRKARRSRNKAKLLKRSYSPDAPFQAIFSAIPQQRPEVSVIRDESTPGYRRMQQIADDLTQQNRELRRQLQMNERFDRNDTRARETRRLISTTSICCAIIRALGSNAGMADDDAIVSRAARMYKQIELEVGDDAAQD